MIINNIEVLKLFREDLVDGKERAAKLLDKYYDIAYGPNADYNSEEAQDADVIHDSLLYFIEKADEQIASLDRKIAKEEKHITKDKAE